MKGRADGPLFLKSLESNDPSVGEQVHPHGCRHLGESGHEGQGSTDGDDESRTCGELNLSDVEDPSLGCSLLLGVIGQGCLGLGDAHREVSETVCLHSGNRLICRRGVDDIVCTVDLGGHCLNLVLDGGLEVVEELEVGLLVLECIDDGLCELDGSLSALYEGIGECDPDPDLLAVLPDEGDLLVGVVCEVVDRDDDGDTVGGHVLDVLVEVAESLGECLESECLGLVEDSASMGHECPDRCDDDDTVGPHSGLPANDVHELLSSEIGGETGLGDDVIAEFQRGLGGDDAVRTVCDVGEGESVDEDGLSLEGLDQVRVDGVLEEDHHASDTAEGSDGDGFVK